MAELPEACARLREVAAEVALGVLEGPERGEALAHAGSCAACRAHVQELSAAVDELLAAAPQAEPPPGFETSVLERIAALDRPPSRTRRPRLALAAAAVVLVIAGAVAGFALADRGSGRGGDDGGELAWAVMTAPGGDEVGEVWRYGEEAAMLFVAVPAWADLDAGGPSYALRLGLADGRAVDVGDFRLGSGTSSWGVATEVAPEAIRSVSVVDDTGRVWCTGRFA